jgi:hypothetical protein
MSKLRNWWRKFRKLDCPKCDKPLDKWGYCDPCNGYPHRKWITDAEDLNMSDIAFMREHPEEYEKHERESRKLSVFLHLCYRENPLERRLLVSIYGEEIVAEAEEELKNFDKDEKTKNENKINDLYKTLRDESNQETRKEILAQIRELQEVEAKKMAEIAKDRRHLPQDALTILDDIPWGNNLFE